jgi:hypothetical protein
MNPNPTSGFTGDPSAAAHYICKQIEGPIHIDGDIQKPVWLSANWSPRLVDMVTGLPGLYDTRVAALWDQTHLYFAFWAEDPFVTAHLTERDSIIFQESDLEILIDGGDSYYELEVNALNTVYEVFFIWKDAYQRGSRWDIPEFDVFQPQALTFGGDYDRVGSTFWYGRHPRGLRWAFPNWDLPGLQTAVKVEGKINDPTTVDKGWSLEVAIPWASLSHLANGRSLPPQNGDEWRIFMGRFQKMTPSGIEVNPHPAWAMNKHGIYDTHLPECWTRVEFQER